MTLYIILGKSCNLRCSYCNQHFEKEIDTTVSNDVYRFIEKEKPEHIVFYGGEPLLYWEAIKEIVEKTNAKYAIITNGLLLDKEKAAFLNKHEFGVTVSWDGYNTKKSRGVDVLEKNIENILKVHNLSFNGVITTENYPADYVEAIRPYLEEYRRKYGYVFGIHMDMIMDDGINFDALSDFDEDRLSSDMEKLCKTYEAAVFGGSHDIAVEVAVNRFSMKDYKPNMPCCEIGHSRVSINLKGEAVLCQGDNTVLGKLETKEIYDITRKSEVFPERYESWCKECRIKEICRNGCQLFSMDAMKRFCHLRKLMLTPVIDMVDRINTRLKEDGFENRFLI